MNTFISRAMTFSHIMHYTLQLHIAYTCSYLFFHQYNHCDSYLKRCFIVLQPRIVSDIVLGLAANATTSRVLALPVKHYKVIKHASIPNFSRISQEVVEVAALDFHSLSNPHQVTPTTAPGPREVFTPLNTFSHLRRQSSLDTHSVSE